MSANSIEPTLRINSGVNRRGCSRRSRLDRQSISLLRRLRACESSVGSLSPAANPNVKSATEYRFCSKRAGKSLGRSAEVAKPGCRASWISLTAEMQRRDAQQPRTAATWGSPTVANRPQSLQHMPWQQSCEHRPACLGKGRLAPCKSRGEVRSLVHRNSPGSRSPSFSLTEPEYVIGEKPHSTQLSGGFTCRLLALHLVVAKFAICAGRLEQCDRWSVLLVRRAR